MCQSCYDDNVHICADDSRHGEVNEDYCNSNDEYICESCSENYSRCESCDDIYHNDDMYYDDDGNYCTSCHDERKPDNGINDYHTAKNKGYRERGKKGSMFIGFELEVESKDNDKGEMVQALQRIDKEELLTYENDGSLNDGFEIISQPISKAYYIDYRGKLNRMLDSLKDNGFRSYDTDTCGMHVHLTKSKFTTYQLYRFLDFFYKNPKFIGLISQRSNAVLEDKSSYCRLYDNDENFDSSDSSLKAIAADKKWNFDAPRYMAINLENSKTVEVRIFKGTLDKVSFHKNIEFCFALYAFCSGRNKTTETAFLSYVSNKRKEYSNLYQWLVNKGKITGIVKQESIAA